MKDKKTLLLEKLMKDIEDESPIVKKYLFGVNIKVGDLIPDAFDPDKEITICSNSTEEFIEKFPNEFKKINENPNKIPVETKTDLYNKMADLELSYILKNRTDLKFYN